MGNGGNPGGRIQSHTWLKVTDVCRRENQPKQLKRNENCSEAGEKLGSCSPPLRQEDLLPDGVWSCLCLAEEDGEGRESTALSLEL